MEVPWLADLADQHHGEPEASDAAQQKPARPQPGDSLAHEDDEKGAEKIGDRARREIVKDDQP
jgi:hypothetical protein